MKVALVRLPAYDTSCAPLNLACLSSYLKKNKHKVKCWDFNIESYNKASRKNKSKLWSLNNYLFWNREEDIREIVSPQALESWEKRVIDYGPDVVGLSIYTTNIVASVKLAENLKKTRPKIKIVFGGPYCRRENGIALKLIEKDCSDAVVVGEGEEAFLELLNALKDGRFGRCAGAMIKEKGKAVDCGPREPIKGLDLLPYPDFSDFNFDAYTDVIVPVLSSRGCPNTCAFCNDRSYWQKFRQRSAASIADEIERQGNKYGVWRFYFSDLLMNGNKKTLVSLCEKLIELQKNKKKRVSWKGYVSFNNMDKDTVLLMKLAGCEFLFFGLESGSDRNLRSVNKITDLKKAEEILKTCSLAGIKANVAWIVGFPRESEADFLRSVAFAKKIRPYLSGFTAANLLSAPPGSDLREKPEQFGIRSVHPEDWAIWDDGVNSHEDKIRRLEFFNREIEKEYRKGLIS